MTSKRKTPDRRTLNLRAARSAAARGDHARARTIFAWEGIDYTPACETPPAAPGGAQ